MIKCVQVMTNICAKHVFDTLHKHVCIPGIHVMYLIYYTYYLYYIVLMSYLTSNVTSVYIS